MPMLCSASQMFAANVNSCTGMCVCVCIYIYILYIYILYTDIYIYIFSIMTRINVSMNYIIQTIYKCIHTSIYFICMLFF